jgi:DNA invertase Pin-like site-specific DNA recombinase
MGNALDAIRNSGKMIGYIRVSSALQNTDRQLDGLRLDKVFTEKLSGKDRDRPQLAACLEYCREGDVLLVHSMDRLARNVDDLRALVRELTGKGVAVKFVKENLTFNPNGGSSIFDQLMLTLLGAFAEFERSLSRERQREGIAKAKEKGVYKGRKQALPDAKIDELAALAVAGVPKAELARRFKVSRTTVHDYLRQRTQNHALQGTSARAL